MRAIGLLGAIDGELDETNWTALAQAMRAERVHLHVNRRTGAVIVAPPLCIGEAELEDGFERMARAFRAVAERGSA